MKQLVMQLWVQWERAGILRLRSCRLPSVFIRRPCPPSSPEELRNSWGALAPWELPQFIATANLPPPSRLPPSSRFSRLSVGPAPEYFSLGRGRFLQLLNMPLSPCCPYHPAAVPCRFGQPANMSCCPRPKAGGSVCGSKFCFEATCGFTFVTAR